MKKLALMLAAVMLTASLTACGCTDRNAGSNGSNSGSGTTQNESGSSSDSKGNSSDGGARSRMGDGMNDMGNGIRNAADDMGDAMDDLFGGRGANPNTTGNNAKPDGLQRMISNAHVHDQDGVLTDGENSRS